MSNKNLLKEGTIRRFMKLAEIDSLANPFVDRINEEIYEAEEDELAGMEGDASAEEAGDEEMPDDMDMGGEEMPDDMGMDPDDEGMEGEGMEGEDDPIAEISTAIADAVTEVFTNMVEDGTLEISQGEDTDEVDLDAEPEGGEEMADIEVSDEEPEEELAESDALKRLTTPWSKEVKACIDAGGSVPACEKKHGKQQAQTNEANIVAEVARRVTKRLLASR